MFFSHSISVLIKNRKSCRSFQKKKVDESRKSDLDRFTKLCNTTDFRFQLIQQSSDESEKRLGTYGTFNNTDLFAVGIVKKGANLLEYGAIFETILLYAEDLGLSGCWVGGSFDRKSLSNTLKIGSDEFIPAIIPLGFSAVKKSFADKLISFIIKSKKRKQWSEIFFDENLNTPLTGFNAHQYRDSFEAVRMAPSAVNKQPWRILSDHRGFHFYLSRDKSMSRFDYDIQMIDMGIALSHFVLTSRENHLKGRIEKSEHILSNGFEYITSYLK